MFSSNRGKYTETYIFRYLIKFTRLFQKAIHHHFSQFSNIYSVVLQQSKIEENKSRYLYLAPCIY